MPESYGWDTIEAAEELYIIDGLTFEQVAERTGVSVSQLKRWSGESNPSWPDRRREYRQAQVSVRRGVMLAKAKLIESVIETEDAQKAYAFGALVNSGKVIEQEAKERTATPGYSGYSGDTIPNSAANSVHVPGITPGAPVSADSIMEAIRAKAAAMLQQPGGITLAAVKELMQVMELIEKAQAKRTVVDPEDGTIDAATIKSIREQFGL